MAHGGSHRAHSGDDEGAAKPVGQHRSTASPGEVPRSKWKLEEALEFLNGPDFFPVASDPAQIEFDGPRQFKFATPRPGKVEENNIVYGRLYRCAEHGQERPVIILLDGSPPVGYHSAFPLLARRFNRAGSLRRKPGMRPIEPHFRPNRIRRTPTQRRKTVVELFGQGAEEN